MPNFDDFIERNSINGEYSWESGLEALLSCITPDAKGIVLKAMREGEWYGSRWYNIYERVLDYLDENFGIDFFPLASNSSWIYLDSSRGGGGSLYKVGVVLRQEIEIERPPHVRFIYAINDAGIYLARPSVDAAIEFVWKVKKFKENGKLKYSSMWRILSTCLSKTEKRRQIVVYDIIKFLLNVKEARRIDIEKEFKDKYDEVVISYALNSLGKVGIIDYKSPHRDIKGKKAKGWAVYYRKKKIDENEKEELYNEFKLKYRGKTLFYNICEYINNNEIAEYNEIGEKLECKHHLHNISKCLSFLEKKGYLESEFKGSVKHSIAKSNEITKMFYEIVLEPVAYIARNLDGSIINYDIDGDKVYYFLINYDRERSCRGIEGGREIANAIIRVLERNGKEMKLSHIREEVIKIVGREISGKGIGAQLKNLIRGGRVEKVGRGFYKVIKK